MICLVVNNSVLVQVQNQSALQQDRLSFHSIKYAYETANGCSKNTVHHSYRSRHMMRCYSKRYDESRHGSGKDCQSPHQFLRHNFLCCCNAKYYPETSLNFCLRYGRGHKCVPYIISMLQLSPPIECDSWCDPPHAMDDEYKTRSAIVTYIKYYTFGKSHLHSWSPCFIRKMTSRQSKSGSAASNASIFNTNAAIYTVRHGRRIRRRISIRIVVL